MDKPIEALRVPAAQDLNPLLHFLRAKGIACYAFEEGTQQVLLVRDELDVAQVQAYYQQWQSGALEIELVMQPGSQTRRSWWRSALAAPLTIVLIIGSIVGFLLMSTESVHLVGLLTYLPLVEVNGRVGFGDAAGQYWRLFTPAFLHFSVLHLTFNALWLWELGRKIERAVGTSHMLGLFLVMAIVSNVAQFLYSGPSLFGGMSGVVYGLLGFSWVGGVINPAWPIKPRAGLMLFMIGWLVFCMTGAMGLLGFGAIANAAHVGGLIAGAVLAVPLALLYRQQTQL